jgi:hypothetical protein
VTVAERYTTEEKEFDDERNTEIARSEKVLADLLEKLEGIVTAAVNARDSAEDSRAAQEIVKFAAEADFAIKDKALEAAKTLQADEVAEGEKVSAEEIANANSAFDSETASYDTLKKSQITLLDKEDALLKSIKAALEGNGFSLSGKTEHAAIDTCAAELGPLKTAKATLVKTGADCASFKALAAGGAAATASAEEEAACTALPGAEADAKQAAETYNACISKPAALISVNTALAQLHSKYLNSAYDYETAKAELNAEIAKIEASLAAERKKMVDQYDADVDSSTDKRDTEITRSKKVLADLIAKHKGLVADAQKLRDDALDVQTTEQAKYAKLVGILNEKQAAYEAALEKQAKEGAAGRELSTNEIAAANLRYSTNAARILNIKNTDTKYINAELQAVTMVENIVAELNITNEVTTGV